MKRLPRPLAIPSVHQALNLLLVGMLCLAPAACFESNSEQPPPEVSGGGNPPPAVDILANNDTLSIAPNTVGTVDIFRNDSAVDGFSLKTFDTVSSNQGSISDNGDGTLTYTPATDFTGVDSFNYTIIDTHNHEASASVSVRVDPVVIVEGKAYYQQKCAICHSAGNDDNSRAFLASDLSLRQSPLQPDLSIYGGEFQLMGAFYDVEQEKIDVLKAYLNNF